MENYDHSRFSYLAKHLSHTQDKSHKRKIAKILNLQLQEMEARNQNQNPPSFCYYCKEPGHWKRDC